MKLIAGIVAGFIIAILGMIEVSVASGPRSKSVVALIIVFTVLWIGSVVVALMSPSAGKAWRRLLIAAAIFAFMLPLSGIIFTGSHVVETASSGQQHAGAAAAGAAIGGTFVTGFMGIVGFFLGAIFLVIGLLVGRERETVYISESEATPGRLARVVSREPDKPRRFSMMEFPSNDEVRRKKSNDSLR